MKKIALFILMLPLICWGQIYNNTVTTNTDDWLKSNLPAFLGVTNLNQFNYQFNSPLATVTNAGTISVSFTGSTNFTYLTITNNYYFTNNLNVTGDVSGSGNSATGMVLGISAAGRSTIAAIAATNTTLIAAIAASNYNTLAAYTNNTYATSNALVSSITASNLASIAATNTATLKTVTNLIAAVPTNAPLAYRAGAFWTYGGSQTTNITFSSSLGTTNYCLHVVRLQPPLTGSSGQAYIILATETNLTATGFQAMIISAATVTNCLWHYLAIPFQ